MNKRDRERLGRLLGITDEAGIGRIQGTRIAIGGLGLGGSVFINLVRMGFRDFHVADPDIYERTNIGRQRLAKESTLGQRKDVALIAEAKDINPDIWVKAFPNGVSASNVDQFLEGVHWAVDVVDVFAMPAKIALHEAAHRKGINIIGGGSLGFSGCAVAFEKGSPSFAEISGLSLENSYEENFKRFVRYLSPEVPAYMADQLMRSANGSTHVPFAVQGVEISAAMMASHISNAVLQLGDRVVAPYGMYFNPVTMRAETFVADYRIRELPARPSPTGSAKVFLMRISNGTKKAA